MKGTLDQQLTALCEVLLDNSMGDMAQVAKTARDRLRRLGNASPFKEPDNMGFDPEAQGYFQNESRIKYAKDGKE